MRAMTSYDGIDARAFWRHSVTVGLLADLTSRSRCVRPAEAFTAGVLHNLGRLALDHARPAEFRRARRFAEDYRVPHHVAERRLLGFTDAEVGGALALRWGFPADLATAIARHADAPPATAEEATSLAGVVARARAFAMAHGINDGVDRLEPARCTSSRAPVSAFSATMSVMSPDDLPSTDSDDSLPRHEDTRDALDRLVAEQGGLESVLDRAAAFVEHTVASS
jgi:HD-like signal output (HDOD) protein